VKLRRDILLFGAVAIAAVAGGWWLLANRPGAAMETFQQEQRRLAAAAQPLAASADAFRATVCADGPCVVIEAGGLTFVFGAGRGAAEGIRALGLMRPNIDALLLPDLSVGTVEGLPAIAAAGAERREALKVYGPAGVLPVVDGANLIVSAAQQGRLSAGIEGEDQGTSGRVLFDSGVVGIRAFGGNERGAGRVYRVDFDGRSLILAGCAALSAEILAAAREAKSPGAIVMAGSERLRGSPSHCAEVATVAKALGQANVQAGLVIPADPSGHIPGAAQAWRSVLGDHGAPGLQIGLRGDIIDMAGDSPRLQTGR
jgi:hypothetical protein